MFRIVSLAVVLTLIVILGITFFKVVAPFLMPLFVAGMVAILAQPLFQYFVRRTNGRVRLASGLATGTVVLAIMTPLVVGTAIASMQMFVFATDSARWDRVFGSGPVSAGQRTDSVAEWIAEHLNNLRGVPPLEDERHRHSDEDRPEVDDPAMGVDSQLEDFAPQEVDPTPEDLAGTTTDQPSDARGDKVGRPVEDTDTVPIVVASESDDIEDQAAQAMREGRRITAEQIKTLARAKAQEFLISLGDRSLGIFTGVVFSIIAATVALLIFTVALYYFFADGTALLAATEKLIPVHVDYQREMLNEFSRAVRGVVSATFLAALGQALATTVALWLCGFDHLLILFVLSMLSAMIPALGTWLVWGPCALLLLLDDPSRPVAAGFLAAYGAIVVGLLDNVIRTYVLNSDIKLHPLLALISVLGGLQMMGLWGVFIGPIVASCLYALIRIFNSELMELSRTRFGDQAAAAAETLVSNIDAEDDDATEVLSPVVAKQQPAAGDSASSNKPDAEPKSGEQRTKPQKSGGRKSSRRRR